MKKLSKENQYHRHLQYVAKVSARSGTYVWGHKAKHGTKCMRTKNGDVVQWRREQRADRRAARIAANRRNAGGACFVRGPQ